MEVTADDSGNGLMILASGKLASLILASKGSQSDKGYVGKGRAEKGILQMSFVSGIYIYIY